MITPMSISSHKRNISASGSPKSQREFHRKYRISKHFLRMLPQKTLEYLFYLVVFIVLCKCSDAATFKMAEDSTVATPTLSSFSKRDAMKRAFGGDCETAMSWMCLRMEFVKIVERLAEQEELPLVPGISVVKEANATEPKAAEMMAEVARSYPNDPSSRLNGYIVAKLGNFLQSRYLRFKLLDSNTVAEARSAVSTGRKGKFGKKGGMEALVAAGIMMKGTLMAIGMGAIALMAGKALMTALMALTLSGVLGLKSLASGGGKSTTYEIVAKPIYTSSHSHSVSHEHDHGHEHGHSGHMGHSASGYGGAYARALKLEVPNHLHAEAETIGVQ